MKKFLYMKIHQDIVTSIETGHLKPGDKLSTETELCEIYSVSRDTIRKALSKLKSDGLIERTPSLGTYIKNTKKNYPLLKIESFTEQMFKIGAKPSSEILLIQLVEDVKPNIMKLLALAEGELYYKVCRIRKADDLPMAYEISYIRQSYCPDFLQHLNNTASIYNIFSKIYKLNLAYENISLEAELPNKKVSKHLDISTESPVLKMKCTLFMEDDIPLYYVNCYYRGDKYIFSSHIPW